MTPIDWCVLCVYMTATIGLGLWVSRSNQNGRDYLLGGGQMGWFVVGMSLIATSLSASTFLGSPSYSYQYNFALLLNQVGSLGSVLIVSKIFIHRYREAKVQSAYELLERNFSRSVRICGATFYCAHLLLRSGILIFGPALVLSKMLNCSMDATIVVTALVSMTYTAFGGLKAVVLTDALQFMVICLGVTFTFLILDQQVGLANLWEVASHAGRTQIFPSSHSVWEWIDPRSATSVLSAMVIYTVMEVAIRGCDQQFVQRYLACKNIGAALKSSYFSIVLGLPAAFAFYAIGALLFAYYQSGPSTQPNMVANEAFPDFIMHHLPSGLRGLLVAAIFAASMSSFDSAINALNNTTISDLLGWNNEDPRSLVVARWGAVPWGLLALLVALWAARSGESLLYQALYFTSLFTGPLLALITLAFFRPHWQPKAVLFGMFFGMFLLVLCSPPEFMKLHDTWVSWPYNPLISCCGAWLGAALVQKVMGPKLHCSP